MSEKEKKRERGQYAESKNEKRTIMVVFRVNRDEYELIEKHATREREGNVGWYCRDRALKKL